VSLTLQGQAARILGSWLAARGPDEIIHIRRNTEGDRESLRVEAVLPDGAVEVLKIRQDQNFEWHEEKQPPEQEAYRSLTRDIITAVGAGAAGGVAGGATSAAVNQVADALRKPKDDPPEPKKD
jgi:hypothetical protein